jgi:Resolvase, N terminal domain/Helix-turn-helix domain of resolvase
MARVRQLDIVAGAAVIPYQPARPCCDVPGGAHQQGGIGTEQDVAGAATSGSNASSDCRSLRSSSTNTSAVPSVKEVLTIADDLHARGVGVGILTGRLSGAYSPTGEGKFFFTMMAAFAELERDIIHERTMAGLAAARAQGRNGGRPTVMDADKLAAARARRERGESPTQIAKALGVSRASVYRHLAADVQGG